MNKEFIPYEQALALKELGFNEACLANYSPKFKLYHSEKNYLFNLKDTMLEKNECKAPLYQQAFRWFREKYKLDGQVTSWTKGQDYEYYYSAEPLGKPSIFRCDKYIGKSYEEAELACLKKLIEIVKNKDGK